MSILETDTERKACSWAADNFGARNVKLQKKLGWPDRLFLWRGKCLFIEFKRKGEEARKIQAHVLQFLKDDGFDSMVIDDLEKFKVFFEVWVKKHERMGPTSLSK